MGLHTLRYGPQASPGIDTHPEKNYQTFFPRKYFSEILLRQFYPIFKQFSGDLGVQKNQKP